MRDNNSSFSTILMVILVVGLAFLLYRLLNSYGIDLLHLPRFSSTGGILEGITSSMRSASDAMIRSFSGLWH